MNEAEMRARMREITRLPEAQGRQVQAGIIALSTAINSVAARRVLAACPPDDEQEVFGITSAACAERIVAQLARPN